MTRPVEFSKEEIANRQIDEAHLRELVSEFNKEGCLILDRVFDPAFIQRLHRAFIRDYQHYLVEKDHPDALCVGNKRYQITIEVKDEFNTEQLYANPLVLSLVEQLLGKRFVISDLTCVASLPGAEDMHIHGDGYIFEGVPIAPLLPPHAVGLLIPLIQFNRLNGVTRL